MLLKSLHIESHRGIEDLELHDLAPVSLIVGPNNTGKSSILEAVSLLLRPLDPALWLHVARQRDTDADVVDALWSLFRSGGVLRLDDGPKQSKHAKIAGTVDGSERRVNARAIASDDPDVQGEGAAEVRISVKVDARPRHDMIFRRKGRARWGEGVDHYKCFTVTPLTHRSGATLVEYLSRVVDEGQKSLALELLQLFDSDVESLDVSAGQRRQTIVVKHRERGVVDLASFGDGMRRVVALALALSLAEKGVLLIDELESGIHPGVLTEVTKRLVNAAARADVQVIATTHSLEAIDALLDATTDSREAVAAYHMFENGRTDLVRRYDHDKLRRLRAGGLDLR
jgi:ABC-type polar amino acid transport system ATPase subunit